MLPGEGSGVVLHELSLGCQKFVVCVCQGESTVPSETEALAYEILEYSLDRPPRFLFIRWIADVCIENSRVLRSRSP